ncbi:afadin [Galendromus occidentalis]|uniref:Afadin n=1 Tax=Galendromus occidentalis TaxID=34638 RepID=A0AAJ7SG68_9ACAR|nr:afadin [Galendromus occidentalis]
MTSVEFDKRLEERSALRSLISQWNANRLDLFALSEPNEDLEFHGVMRFYFQDADQRVVTKCLRVASSATVRDVVPTLIEKFRPDIRMLSAPDYSQYALYEIHENGDERKLMDDQRPLVVQLRWHEDDREGRFLFRRMDAKSYLPRLNEENSLRFQKKRMSKREKKKLAKKQAESASQIKENGDEKIAQRLYTEMPETSFTRSISNPEAVMRRRRQQKLERKLQQFREESAALGISSAVCGPGAGGTLRIFGESLNKDVPYKTLLLSTQDSAAHVVREILEKYGMVNEDPVKYCLVQVFVQHPPNGSADGSLPTDTSLVKEYILDDDDCPLAIERQHNRLKGTLSFHIRRRPHDYQPRKRKKKTKNTQLPDGMSLDKLPYLQEIRASPDGSTVEEGAVHRLLLDMTEIGGAGGIVPPHQQSLELPGLLPRHCVIAHTQGGVVTVTPSGDPNAETFLNGQLIRSTTILQHGAILKLGQLHTFRFVDPAMAAYPQAMQNPQPQRIDPMGPRPASVSGEYDSKNNERHPSTNSDGSQLEMGPSHVPHPQPQLRDPILPAVLEFWEDHENVFLDSVVSRLDPAQVQFKLAPTYTLYMAARYRASTHFRPECSPNERAQRLTKVINKVASSIHRCVEERCNMPVPNSAPMAQHRVHCLSFWLANASELLNFLKNDRHLSAYTLDAQDVLAEGVRLCFGSLVGCLQADLDSALPPFIRNPTDKTDVDGAIQDVINVLSGSMTLLRRCRVNAALTIQLFSQLFHFLNMWVFNATIKSAFNASSDHNMCHHLWGSCLKKRLSKVVTWAEKEGLELAADCRLSRIIQAAHLLETQKLPEYAAELARTCFKLNSLQLRALLERYQVDVENGEPPLSSHFVEQICKMVESQEAAKPEQDVRLEEDPDLQLPFLLPEDGYSCEAIRGVPPGLTEFLAPLTNAGLCRLTLQPTSIGLWTIYMSDQDIHMRAPSFSREMPPNGGHEEPIHNQPPPHPQAIMQQRPGYPARHEMRQAPMQQPEICILFLKKLNNSMGLSIIAAKGYGQEHLGIYVKSIVPGGAADLDGRLQAGDHLLRVDNHSLIGLSQEMAAQLMTRTGEVARLEVAKQGAILHGLGGLLQQSPMTNRESVRRVSERDIPSRMGIEYPGSQFDPRNAHTLPSMSSMHQQPMGQQRIQESKSVPQLNYPAPMVPNQGYPQAMTEPQGLFENGRAASVSSLPNHYEQPKLPPQVAAQPQHQTQPQQMPHRPQTHPNAPPLGPKPAPGVYQQPRRSGEYDYGESVYQNISLYQQKNVSQAPAAHLQHPYPGAHINQFAAPPMPHQMYGGPVPAGGMQLPGKVAQPAANMHQSAIYGQYQPQAMKPPMGAYGPQQAPPPHMGGPNVAQYENHHIQNSIPESQYNPPPLSQYNHMPPPSQSRTTQNGLAPPQYQNHIPPNRGPSPSRQVKTLQWQETTISEQTVRGERSADPNSLRADAKMDEMREEVHRRQMRQQQQVSAPHQQQAPQASHQSQPGAHSRSEVSRKVEIKDRYEGVGQQMPLAPNGILGKAARDREEKERREIERREEIRASIDEEIEQLAAMPNRDEKQEERLRCLRLESEFQRRAMEGDDEDDEEDLAARRHQDRERISQIQDNIEQARQKHMLQQKREQELREEREAAQQKEMEVRRLAIRARGNIIILLDITYRYLATLAEEEEDIPPPLPKSPPPPLDMPTAPNNNNSQPTGLQPLQSVLKNSNGILNSPSKGNLKHTNFNNNNNNNHGEQPSNPPAKKKVSFHETHLEVSYDNYEDDYYDEEEEEDEQMMENDDYHNHMAMQVQMEQAQQNQHLHQVQQVHHQVQDQQQPPHQEIVNGGRSGIVEDSQEAEKYTLEDIDEVLNQPQLTFSPQAPGVIGSQEVYRDPRQRIISAKQSQKESSPPVGPEKLTFQEKMKMFAKEVGERTPQAKTSVSKAQREIDHLATPPTSH